MDIKIYKNISARALKLEKRVGVRSMNANIKKLQEKLSLNMNKAVSLANKNTIRNQQGYVTIPKDDEWRNEDDWNK